jgi:lysophospholipase L1-like esterase
MARNSKPATFASSIGLSIATILLCLFVGEFYLTVRYNNEIARIESVSGKRELCSTRSEFPELIYTRTPGKCDANSHGFRDYEYDYPKAEGVYRIVVIGDSIAAGHGIKLRDTFAKVLERKLNVLPKPEAQRVEIIVLAQSGYSTSQELFLLQHEAFRYSPDLIVWSYVMNDPAHPVYHNSNGELGRYYFKPRFHTVDFVSRKLFEINERNKSDGCDKEYHALIHCVYWDEVASNIGKIAEISAQSQVPILFLIFPLFEENGSFDKYSLASVHAKLVATAKKAGLPVVDLLEVYGSHAPQELILPPVRGHDPLHPNEVGHSIAADYLFDYIMAAGYTALPKR